mgnify:CR=1 FL=1
MMTTREKHCAALVLALALAAGCASRAPAPPAAAPPPGVAAASEAASAPSPTVPAAAAEALRARLRAAIEHEPIVRRVEVFFGFQIDLFGTHGGEFALVEGDYSVFNHLAISKMCSATA